MTTRRQFLYGAAGMLAATGLPIRTLKAAEFSNRKFLFVFNPGGWDPTRVFVPAFSNSQVAMEANADLATVGGIPFVDHPERPSVRSFFETNADRMLVFNGVLVRSIAHDICTMIALTGSSDGTSPDWPAILASRESDQYTLPHLVLDGPSYPGNLGVAVARTGTGGQLDALTSGEAVQQSDLTTVKLKRPSRDLIDRFLARRAAANVQGSLGVHRRLASDFQASLDKARLLEDLRYTMDFAGGAALEDQIDLATEALSRGVSRCVSLAHVLGDQGWDTHANNDVAQSLLWESLFQGLSVLMERLDTTPGTSSATLTEETTIVVLSEMGRTPMKNGNDGKDHWPYTSVLMMGAGITGGRVIGSFDDNYYGKTIDPSSGEQADSGQTLSVESIGATLLTLADIDPKPYVAGVQAITGALA